MAGRFDLDATAANDAATTLRNVAASAFHVPATHLTEALNALEAGAVALNERAAVVAELRAAREARQRLIELHDSYDGPDYRLRGTLWRILATWDGVA